MTLEIAGALLGSGVAVAALLYLIYRYEQRGRN